MLEITDSAVKQFKKILKDSEVPHYGIRIFASGGGCCPTYGLDALEKEEPGDIVIEKDGLKIFIDPNVYNDLANATIDYENGFVIKGMQSSCCG
jgi:iron-sulfur cluster assembly protein